MHLWFFFGSLFSLLCVTAYMCMTGVRGGYVWRWFFADAIFFLTLFFYFYYFSFSFSIYIVFTFHFCILLFFPFLLLFFNFFPLHLCGLHYMPNHGFFAFCVAWPRHCPVSLPLIWLRGEVSFFTEDSPVKRNWKGSLHCYLLCS